MVDNRIEKLFERLSHIYEDFPLYCQCLRFLKIRRDGERGGIAYSPELLKICRKPFNMPCRSTMHDTTAFIVQRDIKTTARIALQAMSLVP
jgi:hypothetical protein